MNKVTTIAFSAIFTFLCQFSNAQNNLPEKNSVDRLNIDNVSSQLTEYVSHRQTTSFPDL